MPQNQNQASTSNEFHEESESLLQQSESLETPIQVQRSDTKRVLIRLYISHCLSTWNSRMFEFGAVLFLAFIFQGTLLYSSIYALVRAGSAAVLSSWLGGVVDRSNRLVALRHSIVWQRVPVAVSCLCFIVSMPVQGRSAALTLGLFVLQVFLACVEKLAAGANTVAVERDWAVVISDSLGVPKQDINVSMRRIDLLCKLIAPVSISLIDSFSTRVAIWSVFGMSVACVFIEYLAVAQVYKSVSELARCQSITEETDCNSLESRPSSQSTIQRLTLYIKKAAFPWKEYASNFVFLASVALSSLYLTVLSFGATMVTYLLYTGMSPLQISLMRIGSVTAELSGTLAAPFITSKIGPIRSGLWFLNWQSGCLALIAAAFAFLDNNSWIVATSLVVGVALSRIGLWGFDLAVQFLVQENVEEHARGRFSATEMALQNIFELTSFATTIIFSSPEQFRYPVFISYGATVAAAICFAGYVRKERGHLLHTPKCIGGDKVWMSRRNPRNMA